MVFDNERFVSKNGDILDMLVSVIQQKEILARQETALRSRLKDAMEESEIKRFDYNYLTIRHFQASVVTQINMKKLKEKYPLVTQQCSESKTRDAYIAIYVGKGADYDD